MTSAPIVRLVQDEGAWFEQGDRVSLQRTPSTRPELHAFKDDAGPYEVMRCTRLPVGTPRLLQLALRAIDST